MRVEITVRVTGDENQTAEALLNQVAGLLKSQPTVLVKAVSAAKPEADSADEAEAPAEPRKKRGRPSTKDAAAAQSPAPKGKSKKAAAEVDDSEDEEDDDETEVEEFEDDDETDTEGDADEDDEDEEPEEEKPAKGKAKAKADKGPQFTLEGDIIPAFRKFCSAHGHGAGAEVMKKFGVQSVRDLDAAEYGAVMEALKNYKGKPKKGK